MDSSPPWEILIEADRRFTPSEGFLPLFTVTIEGLLGGSPLDVAGNLWTGH